MNFPYSGTNSFSDLISAQSLLLAFLHSTPPLNNIPMRSSCYLTIICVLGIKKSSYIQGRKNQTLSTQSLDLKYDSIAFANKFKTLNYTLIGLFISPNLIVYLYLHFISPILKLHTFENFTNLINFVFLKEIEWYSIIFLKYSTEDFF